MYRFASTALQTVGGFFNHF